MSQAHEEIRRCANKQFDPKLVEVFLSMPESHWIDLRESLGPEYGALAVFKASVEEELPC